MHRKRTLKALLRKPVTWVALTAASLVLVVALALFEPWQLWHNATVEEALPQATPAGAVASGTPAATGPAQVGAAPAGTAPAGSGAQGTGAPAGAPAASGPTVLAEGDLISHEHPTTGSVRILQLPDGSRYLRLENLDTTSGPLLKVWLTDAPVLPGKDGWRVFDDGRHLDLGELKGNKGSQNYPVPAGVDLSAYSSVSIWCERFSVSFGAAELTRG